MKTCFLFLVTIVLFWAGVWVRSAAVAGLLLTAGAVAFTWAMMRLLKRSRT